MCGSCIVLLYRFKVCASNKHDFLFPSLAVGQFITRQNTNQSLLLKKMKMLMTIDKINKSNVGTP